MSGIFTLDAILALIITFFLVSASAYLVMQPKISRDEYLYQVSLDVLTTAEKNGGLARAVDGDPGKIEEAKLMLPNTVCFQLEVVNQSGVLVFYDDTGCGTPEEYSVGRRSFVSHDDFYIAALRVWYK